MKDRPFLTIGIASYNYADYLLKAFEQIKKQNFKDFELLYCDDGSTDVSVSVIESFIKENPDMNIRLIKGKNEGVLANRNRILEFAKGKYLLICDADDYMADNCLEKLCIPAQEKNADCVIGGFGEADESGVIYKTHIPKEDANKWIYIWHHAQIYKMELVRAHGIKFCSIPDDLCFLQKIHQYAKKVVFVPENVYVWNRHADSTSRTICEQSDWHPKNLWKNITDCMLRIQNERKGETDIWAIRYFLYKWYYLNIADLPVYNRAALKGNIKTMKYQMKQSYPEYRRVTFLIRSLKEADTVFAKAAILGCWIAEGIGCIVLLPIIRNKQRRLHD